MTFSFIKEDIIDSLMFVRGVISSKNVMPILTTIHFYIDGDRALVKASNLDVILSDSIVADSKEKISVCIEAKPLVDIISKLSGKITITVNDKRAVIKSSSGKYVCPAYNGDEFPLNNDTFDIAATMDCEELSSAIKDISASLKPNDLRPIYECAYINVEDCEVAAINYNGCSVKKVSFFEANSSVLLPLYVIHHIKKILKGDRVSIGSGKNWGLCTCGNKSVMFKSVSGKFPNYNQIINATQDGTQTVYTVDSGSLCLMLSKVGVCSDDIHKTVQLQLSNGTLKAKSANIDFGLEAEDVISYTSNSDVNVEASFNANELLSLFSIYEGDVNFKLEAENKPILIGAGSKLISILAPIQ